jgi:hypothetical protein
LTGAAAAKLGQAPELHLEPDLDRIQFLSRFHEQNVRLVLVAVVQQLFLVDASEGLVVLHIEQRPF